MKKIVNIFLVSVYIVCMVCWGLIVYDLLQLNKYLKKNLDFESRLINVEVRMTGVEENVRTTVPYIRMQAMSAKQYLDDAKDENRKRRKQYFVS